LPRQGNGNFIQPANTAAVTATAINSAAFNTLITDIGTEITNSLDRGGRSAMTAALPMGGQKITGLATPTVSTDAATKAYVDSFPIPDQAVNLRNLGDPATPSVFLGTNSNPALTITGVANNGSGLVRVTVASTATFATGQFKIVAKVTGTTEANGRWTITVVDATHIDLQGSTFTNTYISGGTIGGGIDIISLGSGLQVVGSVLSAQPQALSGAQGLIVSNNAGTPNSKIDITADQAIMVAASLAQYATGVSVTVDTSVVGVVNGLDTGSRAASTWYNVFLISNGTTTAGLVSISATAPTMPSGYTYFVRVGAMRTDGSGNFLRTKQLGNKTSYAISLPTVASGTVAFWTAIAVATFVPPTATQIKIIISLRNSGINTSVAVAPNNTAYSNSGNDGASWVLGNANSSYGMSLCEINLEGSNIYYGSNGGGSALAVAYGWTDKVNAT
jgi:hypothetical protein